MSLYKKIKRLLVAPVIWFAAFVFLLEEYLWDVTARLMARLGTIRMIHAIETRISALPSRWAVLAFLLPSSILIPAKLIGLHVLASGHWLIGGLIFLFAKFLGMALFSRIFNLTRPALLQVPWFSRLYQWVMIYRNRIHDFLEHWQAYQQTKHALSKALYLIRGNGRLVRYLRRVRRLKQT